MTASFRFPGVGRLEPRRQRVERPGVDPDIAPIERELALMEHDRPVLAQQLAQPVQRARERTMSGIAVDARPERVDDARFAHLLAAVGNEELQELERPALRLAAAAERLAMPLDAERTERIDAEHPGPSLD